MVFLGEEVHGATPPLAAAGFLAKQLTHDLPGRHAAAEGMDVVAIGAAEPIVLEFHRPDHAGANRFLTVIQMDETKHLAAVIHLGALVFEAAPEGHVAVEHQTLFARHRGGGGGIEG